MLAKFRTNVMRRRERMDKKIRQFLNENAGKWIRCYPLSHYYVAIKLNGKIFSVPSILIESVINDERKYYKICDSCGNINDNCDDKCQKCNGKEFSRITKNPLSENFIKKIIRKTFNV